jgi:hypothetical protein
LRGVKEPRMTPPASPRKIGMIIPLKQTKQNEHRDRCLIPTKMVGKREITKGRYEMILPLIEIGHQS